MPTDPRSRIRLVILPLIAVSALALVALPQLRGPDSPSQGSAVPTAVAGVSASPAMTEPPPSRAPAVAWTVPFLSRPKSPAISLSNCQDVVIENRTFKDLGPDVEAIRIENCHGVTIRSNDFARVAQAITAADSTDIRVEWNRYSEILGPHERVGLNRANFVQFDQVRGGYIGNNKGRGGDTEDIVSLHDSGGSASEPLVVEYNHFEGTDWSSQSGSGIALGDSGSSHSIARNNVLLNPGQVGIFIAGGTNHAIIDNVVYGEQRPSSNVGIYVWSQTDGECSGHEVSGNNVFWLRADGEPNTGWDAGNCGPITGWTTNEFQPVLDPAQLTVDLDDPVPTGALEALAD